MPVSFPVGSRHDVMPYDICLLFPIGDALSSVAELEYNKAEREREQWEMQVSMESEINEMVDLYEARGISREDSEIIWRTLAKYPTAFLDIMMVEELHLLPADESDNPWRGGLITCIAFMLFGVIPLIPFMLPALPFIHWSSDLQMQLSVALTVLTLFILGAAKARLAALGESWIQSGLQMAALGSTAALVSYLVGLVLKQTFGVDM